jgi:hypothetical protein
MNMTHVPKPGSVVEVITHLRSIYYFSTVPYDEFHYVGVVIDSPKWIEHNSFALATGDTEVEFHVISPDSVVGIQYLEGEPGREIVIPQKTEFFKIKDYTVTRSKSGYSCTCVGYKYHKKCKHILQVMQEHNESK